MKVGEILKEEVKDIQGLQLPYKYLINNKFRYSENKKLEDSIYLKYAFMNYIYSSPNYKSFKRSQSFSKSLFKKKNIEYSNLFKDFISKFSKNKEKSLNSNLPVINDNTFQRRKLKSKSTKKIIPGIYSEFHIQTKNDNYDKMIENYNIDINSNIYKMLDLSVYNTEYTLCSKTKNSKKSKIKNSFIKNINKNNNIKNDLKSRYERKFKIMNHFISKLNKPLFKYNNIDNKNNKNKNFYSPQQYLKKEKNHYFK